MLNLITDIAGISIGHATDLELGSGVTAIVFDKPATASGTVLGGAPGGRDTALLDPSMLVEQVDAFVLSGGSAFGLDAARRRAGRRSSGRWPRLRGRRCPCTDRAAGDPDGPHQWRQQGLGPSIALSRYGL